MAKQLHEELGLSDDVLRVRESDVAFVEYDGSLYGVGVRGRCMAAREEEGCVFGSTLIVDAIFRGPQLTEENWLADIDVLQELLQTHLDGTLVKGSLQSFADSTARALSLAKNLRAISSVQVLVDDGVAQATATQSTTGTTTTRFAQHSASAYLAAKQEVDRAAMNEDILEALREALNSVDKEALIVLDLGAGCLSMLDIVAGLYEGRDMRYIAVDACPDMQAVVENLADFEREKAEAAGSVSGVALASSWSTRKPMWRRGRAIERLISSLDAVLSILWNQRPSAARSADLHPARSHTFLSASAARRGRTRQDARKSLTHTTRSSDKMVSIFRNKSFLMRLSSLALRALLWGIRHGTLKARRHTTIFLSA